MTREIRVARDFSRFPFGRYRGISEWSGERFRDELLIPAMRSGDKVVVDLDGARGLSPSFLEEAFGGLVRKGFQARDILARLTIKSDRDPSFIQLITEYISAARPA